MTKLQIQRSNDYEAICAATREWGGLKEPELCAMLNLDERRVMLTVREFVKLGFLTINTTGEVVETAFGEVRREFHQATEGAV